MKAALTSIVLFVAGALAFTINTPSNVVECQPTLLSWDGGVEPYYLRRALILPGASPSGPALESFPATNANSITWQCNIANGTSIGFTLRDSTGATAQTAPVTVQSGTTDCTNTTSYSAGPTVASTSAASTSVAAATTGSSASAGTTGASSASASATASATSSSGSAPANVAQFAFAGVAGVAVAALLL